MKVNGQKKKQENFFKKWIRKISLMRLLKKRLFPRGCCIEGLKGLSRH